MKTESTPFTRSRKPAARHHLEVALRALTAVTGSYALASLVSVLLALSLPLSRAEALIAGGMASFVVFPTVAIWSFWTSSALRAFTGVIASGLILTVTVWLMRGTL